MLWLQPCYDFQTRFEIQIKGQVHPKWKIQSSSTADRENFVREVEVSLSTTRLWSLTTRQHCGTLLNSWSRWGLVLTCKTNLKCLHTAHLSIIRIPNWFKKMLVTIVFQVKGFTHTPSEVSVWAWSCIEGVNITFSNQFGISGLPGTWTTRGDDDDDDNDDFVILKRVPIYFSCTGEPCHTVFAVKLQKCKSIINFMKLQDVISSKWNGWESHFEEDRFCWFLFAITTTSLRLLWPKYKFASSLFVCFSVSNPFMQWFITSLFNLIHRESVNLRREFPHQVFFFFQVLHKE